MVFRRMAKMPGASMKIPRSFHVPATASTTSNIMYLDVRESSAPDTICIKIDDMAAYLTKEEFEALCDLRYKVDWVKEELEALRDLKYGEPPEAASAPIEELPF